LSGAKLILQVQAINCCLLFLWTLRLSSGCIQQF